MSGDPNKPQIWSEQGLHGVVRDAVFGAEVGEHLQTDDTAKIQDTVVKSGVLLQADCLFCGKQWKAVTSWSDVSFFFLGQPVSGVTATKAGIRWPCPCRCGRATPVLFSWEDVKRWVDAGVRTGALKSEIYSAAGIR